MDLTTNELQFMNVLWNSDKPLTCSEILKQSENKKWKDASQYVILNKLMEKGAVCEVGFVKNGKAISRTFAPVWKREEYYETVFCEGAEEGIPDIFSALVRGKDIKKETIEKLEKILKDMKGEKSQSG